MNRRDTNGRGASARARQAPPASNALRRALAAIIERGQLGPAEEAEAWRAFSPRSR